MQAFLADPEPFLESAPTDVARRASMFERADAKLKPALEGHCPVTLTETGKLVRTRVSIVHYGSNTFCISDEAKAVRFLQEPDKFVHKRLPARELRYLYPGLGEKSTLMHLAKQLRASNPLNTKARQKTSEDELKRFLRNCAMPQDMKASITRRQEASEGKLKWTALDEKRYKELTALFDAHFKPTKGAAHPVKAVLSNA